MTIKEKLVEFKEFLKKDSWQSWLVSLILIIILIKFVLFPGISFITNSPVPIAVVESCSMYHESSFEQWWSSNSPWYISNKITKSDFENYPMKNGLNKGDIVLIWNRGKINKGDIILFSAPTKYPVIHRIISQNPLETKGDNNPSQLDIEKNINSENVLGKATLRIPYLGWIKLVFFDLVKPAEERGACKSNSIPPNEIDIQISR